MTTRRQIRRTTIADRKKELAKKAALEKLAGIPDETDKRYKIEVIKDYGHEMHVSVFRRNSDVVAKTDFETECAIMQNLRKGIKFTGLVQLFDRKKLIDQCIIEL